MDNRQGMRGLLTVLGSPKILLGQIVAVALFALFASPIGRSEASAGAQGQGLSTWVVGQPPSVDLGLLPWALVAVLSLSAVIGLTARWTTGDAKANRWAQGGILACHSGLLLIGLGGAVGEGLGFREQVLVPRSGSPSEVQPPGGDAVQIPFALEQAPGSYENTGDSSIRRFPDGSARIVLTKEELGVLPQELHLYPAGETRVGASGALRVLDRSGRVLLDEMEVREGDVVSVPESRAVIEVAGLWKNRDDLGPAVQLVLRDPTRGTEVFLVFRALPGWDKGRGGDFVFQLSSFVPGREYLRFWVVKDPGLPLAATGGLLLFAGSLAGLAGWRRQGPPPSATGNQTGTVPAFQDAHLPLDILDWWRCTESTADPGMTPEVLARGERCTLA